QAGPAEREQSEAETAGRPSPRLVLEIEAEIPVGDRREVPERTIEIPDVVGRCALLRPVGGARTRRAAQWVVDFGHAHAVDDVEARIDAGGVDPRQAHQGRPTLVDLDPR